MKLTKPQWRLLAQGFRGPRPGSNALALLGLLDGEAVITGEQIQALLREGFLDVRPVTGAVEVVGGAASSAEIPEVEMTHNYELSSHGRRACGHALEGAD